ncbi:MAG: cytochrome c [Azonexus sp.]
MKPAAVFLGLACVVLAPGALGTTATAKKAVSVKKTVAVKKMAAVKKTVVVKKVTQSPSPSSPKLVQAKKVQPAPVSTPAKPDNANDERELIRMPSPARLAMRAEMRDRMSALDSVLQRMRDGQVVEAGQIAQIRLGVALWGNHSRLPKSAQPEQYMPQEMQTLALDGYKAASDFATVALTGDQHTATAMLPQLTGSCAQCHQAYRIR